MMKITACLLLLSGLLMNQTANAVSEEQRHAVRQALSVNDWGEALDLAEDLVDDFPDSSVAHYLLANALRLKMQEVSQVRAMFSLGDYKAALAKAIELDPANVDARTEEIGFYLFAPGVAGGDKQLAAEKIQSLKAVNQVKGLEMEAQLAAVNEDQAKAAELLRQVVALKPNSPGALMQLAVMAMQTNDVSGADQHLNQITAEDDAGWPLMAQYQKAKARVLAGVEADTAIELLNAYLAALPGVVSKLNLPDEAAVYWRMALAFESKGNHSKAIELLQRSVQLNDDFEPARDDLERLTE